MNESKGTAVCLKKSSDTTSAAVVLAIDAKTTEAPDGKKETRAEVVITLQFNDPQQADKYIIGKNYSVNIDQQ